MARFRITRRLQIPVYAQVVAVAWLACLVAAQSVAPPAQPAQAAQAESSQAPHGASAQACTLRGRVPVLPRKAAGGGKGAYAGKPGERVDPPDAPASVVWMTGAFAPVESAKAPPVTLEQRGLQFRPSVLAVQCGTPVVFPNRDPIYHSVFSYSAARKFDLGRYRTGEEPPAVVFDKPGTVTLFCEVHDHMRGAIVVVDSPHFVCTDEQGRFTLQGLPPGTHTFKVWLDPKQTIERTVELKPGVVTDVDWTASG